MKKIFLSFSILFSIFFSVHAVELKEMSKKERKQYLVSIAKEVTLAFAPDYYRDYKNPIILGPYSYDVNAWDFDEKERFIGREYYTVVIPYDFQKENLENDFAAKVQIWADDGTPMAFQSGGATYILHFMCTSFEQYKKDGIPDKWVSKYHERESRYSGHPAFRYNAKEKRSWEIMDEKYKKEKEKTDK